VLDNWRRGLKWMNWLFPIAVVFAGLLLFAGVIHPEEFMAFFSVILVAAIKAAAFAAIPGGFLLGAYVALRG
jgi:hypothetical protein